MNIFRNKFIFKLIVSICLFLTVLNFCVRDEVYAENDEDEIMGSILVVPAMHLITGIADSIMDILHQAALSQDVSLIKIDGSPTWWERYGKMIAILITVVALIALIATGVGAVAAFLAEAGYLAITATTVIKIATISAALGGIGGVLIVNKIDSECFPKDIYLPIYNITPEDIFSNDIRLFDINFFNPMESVTADTSGNTESTTVVIADGDVKINFFGPIGDLIATMEYNYFQREIEWYRYDEFIQERVNDANTTVYERGGRYASIWGTIIEELKGKETTNLTRSELERWLADNLSNDSYQAISGNNNFMDNGLMPEGMGTTTYNNYTKWENSTFTVRGYDYIDVGEGKLIRGLVVEATIHLDLTHTNKADFDDRKLFMIVEQESTGTIEEPEQEILLESTAGKLNTVVSTWYFILRNLALLVLMLVLIYTGIKIVLGSTAGEKAKHKERLKDWLIAMCLVFVLHYIMVFVVELNEKFIGLIKGSTVNRVEKIIGLGDEQYANANSQEELKEFIYPDDSGTHYILWETDLVGGMRIEAQTLNEGTAKWVGYSFCYLILVILTCIFAWTYLKRVVYMAFLTMMAPLVAMTYPIDKITDGKAQAFNTWLKEYIFNLLIQPMHLLLYTILVSSAYELAAKNVVYAVVAIGFLTPAEKLIRKFFGFDKAQTPGMLGGAAGAALAFSGMQGIMNFGKNKDKGKKEEKEKKDEIKFKGSNGVNPFEAVAGNKTTKANQGQDSKKDNIRMKDVNVGKEDENKDNSDMSGRNSENNEDNSIRMKDGVGTESQDKNNTDMKDINSDNNQVDKVHTQGANTNSNEEDINSDNNANRNLEESEDNDESEESSKGKDKNKSQNPTMRYTTQPETQEDSNDEGEEVKRVKQKQAAQETEEIAGNAETRTKEQKQKRGHKKIIRRAWETNKAIGKAYTRMLGQKAVKNIKKGKPIRALARGVLGMYGAAAFGMAGLAMGAASGDSSKAFKYATAGIVGGNKLGKSVAGSAVDTFSVDSEKIKDEAEMAWYGKNYKKEKLEQEKEKLIKDEKNIDYIRKTMGVSREDAQKILKETGGKCFDSGIRNIEDIAAIHKMKENLTEEELEERKDNNGSDVAEEDKKSFEEEKLNEAIAFKKLSDRLPSDIDKMGQKKIEEHRKQFKKEIKHKLQQELIQRGLENERAEKLADEQAENKSKEIMKGIVKFADAKAQLEEA